MWRMGGSESLFGGINVGCLAVLALVVTGCQATTSLPTLGSESSAEIKDGSVVFGKISVIGRKGPITWKGFSCRETLTFDCPDVFRVYVFPENAGETFNHMLNGDGSFYWVLKPGTYTIGGYKFEDWSAGQRARYVTGRIAGKFVVPPDTPSVYLGTTKVFLGGGRYGAEVRDEFDSARRELKDQNAAPDGKPYKSLIALERVPGEKKVVGICSGIWGIECTDEIKGVHALSPEVQRDNFATASSRDPLLSWKPSSDREVTYDIVVFKALLLGRDGWNTRYIRGPIIEYARGIKTAQYKLKNKLKPKTKYIWSVRLRKNDTVSSWSSISYKYFAFLLVAAVWGSGSGVYFNFSTP